MTESRGTIRIWRLRMDPTADLGDTELLSRDEQARATRFRRAGDRERWTWCRIRLRQILASCIGCPAAKIAIETANSGKPFLANADLCCPYFNLSHAGDVLAIAVSNELDMGIDVEQVRLLTDLDGVARASLTHSERQQLQGAPASDQMALFFSYWTRKEAILKATGQGLSGLGSVDLAEANVSPTVTSPNWHQGPCWSVCPIEVPIGYRGAIAVCGQADHIKIRYES